MQAVLPAQLPALWNFTFSKSLVDRRLPLINGPLVVLGVCELIRPVGH